MVHGGGHHHSGDHHSSAQQEPHHSNSWGSDSISGRNGLSFGGWSWGHFWQSRRQRPQYINQNVNVATSRFRGMAPYQNTRPGSSERRASSWTNQDECCRNCCLGCCTCWYTAAVAQEAAKCGPMVHWIFLSVCLLILLVIMSTVNETWTFNAGETRRIPARIVLNSHVQIQSEVANGIVVYDIEKSCPALTGPSIPIDESWHFHLAPDDYQFDSYYLTKGSTLTVTFQQNFGATSISLLKGINELHAVQADEDYPSFSTQALLTRYTAAAPCDAHHHGCHEYGPPIVFTYTARESDVYIIVYDNASSFPGRANATIHVDLTTYNLENQVPYQECEAFTCTVSMKRNKCLLLQAPAGGPLVTVHITAKRRWFVISTISLVPLAIALGLRLRPGQTRDEMPPAMNPEQVLNTTAPSDTVDYESIPIVTSEHIVPVAVPVDAAGVSSA